MRGIATLMLVCIAILTGCTTEAAPSQAVPEPTATVTVTASPEPSDTSQPWMDDRNKIYLNQLREDAAFFTGFPDATAIELGHMVCDAFDGGLSGFRIKKVIEKAGVSHKDAVTLMGTAVAAYCIQNLEKAMYS